MILNPGTAVTALSGDLGGRLEVSQVVCVADTGAKEIQTVVAASGATHSQGDYIIVENAAGDSVALWIDIDADGTEPVGLLYAASDDQIEVDVASNESATIVATKIKAAYDLAPLDDLTCTRSNATLTFTNALMGNVTAPFQSNAAEDGDSGFVVATTTAGADSNYNSKFLIFRNGADSVFNAWFDVNSEGVDPNPTGTEVPVEVPAGSTASTVADLLAAAVDAVTGMNADHIGNGIVRITSEAKAGVTDISAGDSGLTVTALKQGASERVSSAGSPANISNNPSVL